MARSKLSSTNASFARCSRSDADAIDSDPQARRKKTTATATATANEKVMMTMGRWIVFRTLDFSGSLFLFILQGMGGVVLLETSFFFFLIHELFAKIKIYKNNNF